MFGRCHGSKMGVKAVDRAWRGIFFVPCQESSSVSRRTTMSWDPSFLSLPHNRFLHKKIAISSRRQTYRIDHISIRLKTPPLFLIPKQSPKSIPVVPPLLFISISLNPHSRVFYTLTTPIRYSNPAPPHQSPAQPSTLPPPPVPHNPPNNSPACLPHSDTPPQYNCLHYSRNCTPRRLPRNR